MTTLDTMTDRQVAGLSDAAAEAGDLQMAAICRRAMGADDADTMHLSCGMTPAEARDACLSAIRDGEAASI